MGAYGVVWKKNETGWRLVDTDIEETLSKVHAEIASYDHTIQSLRAELKVTSAPRIDVTGTWSQRSMSLARGVAIFGQDETIIRMMQDQASGDVDGQISIRGQLSLSFQGRVTEDELVYTTGPRAEATIFRLRPAGESRILRGHWEDFRDGYGQLEMYRLDEADQPPGGSPAPRD